MQGREPAHVAAVRMRGAAPIAALAFPAALVLVAGALAATGSAAAARVLAVAAPTVPLVERLPWRLPSLVAVVVGATLAVPIWGAIGRWLASRTIAIAAPDPADWPGFWQRYVVACLAWVAIAVGAAWALG